jgi:hypothetical protein
MARSKSIETAEEGIDDVPANLRGPYQQVFMIGAKMPQPPLSLDLVSVIQSCNKRFAGIPEEITLNVIFNKEQLHGKADLHVKLHSLEPVLKQN